MLIKNRIILLFFLVIPIGVLAQSAGNALAADNNTSVRDIVNRPVPYDVAQTSLARLMTMVAKNKPEGGISLTGMAAKKTELPSQTALRTYKESISPMRPFED